MKQQHRRKKKKNGGCRTKKKKRVLFICFVVIVFNRKLLFSLTQYSFKTRKAQRKKKGEKTEDTLRTAKRAATTHTQKKIYIYI